MSKVRYWVNVDTVTKSCTVHTSECSHQPRKSKFKNVRSMGRDGGWMPFPDYPSLVKYKRTQFSEFELCFCSFCKTHAQMPHNAEGKPTVGSVRERGR